MFQNASDRYLDPPVLKGLLEGVDHLRRVLRRGDLE